MKGFILVQEKITQNGRVLINKRFDNQGTLIFLRDKTTATTNSTHTYNNKGQLVQSIYNYNEKPLSQHQYTYDNNGNQTKDCFTQFGNGYSHCIKSVYNSMHQRTKIIFERTDIPNAETLFYYDTNGNCKRIEHYQTQDVLSYILEFVYKETQLTIKRCFNETGTLIWKGKYTYNTEGKLTEICYTKHEIPFYKHIYAYNKIYKSIKKYLSVAYAPQFNWINAGKLDIALYLN